MWGCQLCLFRVKDDSCPTFQMNDDDECALRDMVHLCSAAERNMFCISLEKVGRLFVNDVVVVTHLGHDIIESQ